MKIGIISDTHDNVPKIKEAVIVGLPDSMMGEEIHACIILKEGETATQEEIIAYSKGRMAAYKCPKTVPFPIFFVK